MTRNGHSDFSFHVRILFTAIQGKHVLLRNEVEFKRATVISLSSVRTSAFYLRIILLRNFQNTVSISWPISTDGLKPQTWQSEESKQMIVFIIIIISI